MTVLAEHTETAAGPLFEPTLNTPTIAPPPRQAASITLRCILIHNPPSQNERLHAPPMAPVLSPTPSLSPIPWYMRFGVTPTPTPTPTPQPQPMSTVAVPLTLNLPLPISKPNYNVVIAWSSVSMSLQPPMSPTLWTTSLTFHSTPLAPEQDTKNTCGHFDPLKKIAALESDWMDCILLECGH